MLGVLVRIGLIRDLAGHAQMMQRLAAWFDGFGSNHGAMHVRLRGRGNDGRLQSRTWTLIAENGDGPRIPTLAAILLTKKLLNVRGYAPLASRGAMPASNLLSLREFECEWRTLAIRTSVSNERACGSERQIRYGVFTSCDLNHASTYAALSISKLGRAEMSCDALGTLTSAVSILRSFNAW